MTNRPSSGTGSPAAPRVIFVNRFYYPDYSATAQILTDVAAGLAARGMNVRVITSRLMYEDPAAKLAKREQIDGVGVIRVRTTGFGRAGLVGRAADYLTFYAACFLAVLRHTRKGDVAVFKTDPPLLSVPLGIAARLRGARVVNWLQDIFPETAQALGVPVARPPLSTFLKYLRNRSLRRGEVAVVIGQRMADLVETCGVARSQITLIPNFCDEASIQPRRRTDNPLRAAWGLTERDFVIGYSGNLGRAHDLDTLLDAAEILKGRTDVRFLFIGGGQLRQTLEAEIARRGLTSVLLKPYQPREQLALSLCVPDVHWVSLRSELEGLILPSKLYGIAAAGRPMLMIGDPDGDIGRIVRQHGFGDAVPIGAAEQLAWRIADWKKSPELVEAMGARARDYVDAHASRVEVVGRWHSLLSALFAKG